jgi:hypothetical protein
MLSIQKCPTDKTGLEYTTSTSDIPSTFKTLCVKPTVPEPPPACMDKGKAVIGRDVPAITEPTQIPPTKRKPPICHHCGLSCPTQVSTPPCSEIEGQEGATMESYI